MKLAHIARLHHYRQLSLRLEGIKGTENLRSFTN